MQEREDAVMIVVENVTREVDEDEPPPVVLCAMCGNFPSMGTGLKELEWDAGMRRVAQVGNEAQMLVVPRTLCVGCLGEKEAVLRELAQDDVLMGEEPDLGTEASPMSSTQAPDSSARGAPPSAFTPLTPHIGVSAESGSSKAWGRVVVGSVDNDMATLEYVRQVALMVSAKRKRGADSQSNSLSKVRRKRPLSRKVSDESDREAVMTRSDLFGGDPRERSLQGSSAVLTRDVSQLPRPPGGEV